MFKNMQRNTKKNNSKNLPLETTMLLEKIKTTAMHFSTSSKQFSRILLHVQ